MFNIFKKNKSGHELMSIGNGEIINLSEVEDPIFSQKMMGDGYGFRPKDGQIYAPADGKISMIPDTKHGIGMTTNDGLELLIHMGIDTVELKGAPFDIHVQVGDQVQKGQLLATMDLDKIKSADKKTTTMVIVTNSNDLNMSSQTSVGNKKLDEVATVMVDN